MWGPTFSLGSDLSTTWVPVAVLTASLAGSGHCLGMCGGLVTAVGQTRSQWIGYQVGRAFAYTALGAAAGALGGTFMGAGAARELAWVSAGIMAVSFFAMGARAWMGGAPHFNWMPQSILAKLYVRVRGVPILLGMLSAALPCGWLQTFVLTAAATQSAVRGAATLAVFWLGTLPALSAAPWLTSRLLKPARARAPKLTAMLLILAGLAGIGFKMNALFAEDGKMGCHSTE